MERALVSTEVGRERNDFPFGDRKQPCSFRVSQCTWSRQVSETYALCLWVPLTQFAIWPGSHISPAFCVSCYFLFFSFISKRLQDSRYQGLSSKAVGPQTGKRESFQGKNGPVKKNVYSLFPPNLGCSALSEWLFLSWNAAAGGSETFSLHSAAQLRSQGTERAGSLQRAREGSRGKESTVMQSYWI